MEDQVGWHGKATKEDEYRLKNNNLLWIQKVDDYLPDVRKIYIEFNKKNSMS